MVFTAAIAFFNAVAAIPKMAGILQDVCSAAMTWYIKRADMETKRQIADAAAFGARAMTEEDRYAALERWKTVLTRTRFI